MRYLKNILKFFTIKVVNHKGYTRRATWRERLQWVKSGCPLRKKEVVERYVNYIRNPMRKVSKYSRKTSNTALG